MLHSGHPIAFASKTLTDIGTHYMNIEHGFLSMSFSLEKFHTYIYDRHVIVENNCKPLEMIKQKPIHASPPWLQHMLLHMQNYDYTIQYKPSKDMDLADCLSHFLPHVKSPPIPIATNAQHVQLSDAELDIILGSVEHDPVYSTIYPLTL